MRPGQHRLPGIWEQVCCYLRGRLLFINHRSTGPLCPTHRLSIRPPSRKRDPTKKASRHSSPGQSIPTHARVHSGHCCRKTRGPAAPANRRLSCTYLVDRCANPRRNFNVLSIHPSIQLPTPIVGSKPQPLKHPRLPFETRPATHVDWLSARRASACPAPVCKPLACT